MTFALREFLTEGSKESEDSENSRMGVCLPGFKHSLAGCLGVLGTRFSIGTGVGGYMINPG